MNTLTMRKMIPRNGAFSSSLGLVTKFLRNVRQEKGCEVLQVPWARGSPPLSSRQTNLAQTFTEESGVGFQLNQRLTSDKIVRPEILHLSFFSTSTKRGFPLNQSGIKSGISLGLS